jgi:hypothetical protein
MVDELKELDTDDVTGLIGCMLWKATDVVGSAYAAELSSEMRAVCEAARLRRRRDNRGAGHQVFWSPLDALLKCVATSHPVHGPTLAAMLPIQERGCCSSCHHPFDASEPLHYRSRRATAEPFCSVCFIEEGAVGVSAATNHTDADSKNTKSAPKKKKQPKSKSGRPGLTAKPASAPPAAQGLDSSPPQQPWTILPSSGTPWLSCNAKKALKQKAARPRLVAPRLFPPTKPSAPLCAAVGQQGVRPVGMKAAKTPHSVSSGIPWSAVAAGRVMEFKPAVGTKTVGMSVNQPCHVPII